MEGEDCKWSSEWKAKTVSSLTKGRSRLEDSPVNGKLRLQTVHGMEVLDCKQTIRWELKLQAVQGKKV